MIDAEKLKNIRKTRQDDFLETADSLQVHDLALAFLNHNPSKHLPYHNNEHSMCVALHSHQLGVLHKIDSTQLRNLFVAGIFHDWNHSGTGNEAENIRRALDGMFFHVRHDGSFSEEDAWQIMFLIQATDTRFVWPHAALTLPKQIIRDADALQNVVPDYEVFWEGLSVETGRVVDLESTKKFMEHHPLYTVEAGRLVQETGHLN